MPSRVNRFLAPVLAALLALTAAMPSAFAHPGLGSSGVSGCNDCCIASNAKSACASVCAPQAPRGQTDEQTAGKPAGAWAAGIVPVPFIAVRFVGACGIERAVDALGPPLYLSFSRFLL